MAKNTFSLGVDKFINGFDEGAEKTMRTVASKTFNAIVYASPVNSGRFRGSWHATGKTPSSKGVGTLDKDGNKTAQKSEQTVLKLKDWSKFTLTNNLPYANHLEFGLYKPGPNTVNGYSTQAKSGMVRVNIERAARLLEAEAKKNLPK